MKYGIVAFVLEDDGEPCFFTPVLASRFRGWHDSPKGLQIEAIRLAATRKRGPTRCRVAYFIEEAPRGR